MKNEARRMRIRSSFNSGGGPSVGGRLTSGRETLRRIGSLTLLRSPGLERLARPPTMGRPHETSCMRWLTAIPVYNEARHVREVLDQVRRFSPDILVVDDGSTDETPAILS